MMRLLLKKQICMEVGYMLGKIVLMICMIGLIVGMFYGIYMAIWGVWNERQYIEKNSIPDDVSDQLWVVVFNNKIN